MEGVLYFLLKAEDQSSELESFVGSPQEPNLNTMK